ncbi:MAG: flagellar type III secretion system pore protein FliP [Spirochaetes bacterium]|nr:flagellar type III secretion system pore protein FliP [Spirochaetota bacterium]
MKKKYFLLCALLLIITVEGFAQADDGLRRLRPADGDPLTIPFVDITVRQPETNDEVAFSIQLLLLLSVIALSPSIILLMTSFLRIAIVFDFIKRALALQQVPPNQVIMGIALFLTLFIMWPTFNTIYNNAFVPFAEGEISTEEMFRGAEEPLRRFMFAQIHNSGNYDNIRLFMNLSGLPRPNNLSEVPTHVLIPAFVLSELTIAFKIGILIFIPFIIIDMVVASILMSMGMIMLPPIMISMPFKLILFVLVDGWSLITSNLVRSFGG